MSSAPSEAACEASRLATPSGRPWSLRHGTHIYTNQHIWRVSNDVFGVLADPTRRRLLEALASGERSVNELVDQVDIEQPGVSRHLHILQEAGFVTVRPDGQRRWYSLKTEPFGAVVDWVRVVARAQAGSLQRLADLVEEPKRTRTKVEKP